MLLVNVFIKPSEIHGIGCFTNEKIEKGKVVWVFDERIDIRLLTSEIPNLPSPAQAFYNMYGYEEEFDGQRTIVLCGDHAKHMNHSDTPNLLERDGVNYAAEDIEIGEELTCNYYSFDLSAKEKLPGTF